MKYLALKTKPYKHQVEALQASLGHREFGLFMEQGTGKSWVILARFLREWQEGNVDALVVIAPKGVYRNWLDQLQQHWPVGTPIEEAVWGAYRLKEDNIGLAKHLVPVKGKRPRVLLMNVEALSTKDTKRDKRPKSVKGHQLPDVSRCSAVAYLEEYLSVNRCILAVDESTAVKSHRSNRTKQLTLVRGAAKIRMIASGLPVPKSPMDLWGQCLVLGKGLLPFPSYLAFESRYAIKKRVRFGPRSFDVIEGFRDMEHLQGLMQGFTFRVLKEDCLDLPPKIYQVREVELSAQQIRVYNDLAIRFQAEVENGMVATALDAMTRSIRLHQVTCGFLVAEGQNLETSEVVELEHNRMHELVAQIEELHGSVIVWAPYRYSLAAIHRVLADKYGKDSVAPYWGATSPEQREKSIKDFNSGKARFFLGNPDVGGMGLTLNIARSVVYYSNRHKLESRLQSEDRCHRIGQTKSVTYVDLLVRNTVDERVLTCLRASYDIGQKLLGDHRKQAWLDWFSPIGSGALANRPLPKQMSTKPKDNGPIEQAPAFMARRVKRG